MKKIQSTLIILLMIVMPSIAKANNQIVGEIININYQYNVAFTDLSSYYLSKGDIVEISANGEKLTYLKVSESSAAISKLIPITDNSQFRTQIDFSNIKTGFAVTKKNMLTNIASKSKMRIATVPIQKSYNSNTSITETTDQPWKREKQSTTQNSAIDELSRNYITLSNNLAKALEEKSNAEKDQLQKKQELDIAIKQIQELEAKNTLLENELLSLKSKGSAGRAQRKIKKLEKTISELKIRLENMASLLEGN